MIKALSIVLTTAILAVAQNSPAAKSSRDGYLTPTTTPNVILVVPPPPQTGDARFNADMAIFRQTRSLEGTPRWTLAQSDDNVSMAGLLKAFSCSLGITLDSQNAAKTYALLVRANADSSRASGILKALYAHKRPYQVENANICLSAQGKTALERSPDYPSGHATGGWETGLILAELAPQKATEILSRARAFGQSRVVCGVHNLSAVEAGWLTATAVFAAQNSAQEFRADLDAARNELSSLLKNAPPEPQGCPLEHDTLSKNPY